MQYKINSEIATRIEKEITTDKNNSLLPVSIDNREQCTSILQSSTASSCHKDNNNLTNTSENNEHSEDELQIRASPLVSESQDDESQSLIPGCSSPGFIPETQENNSEAIDTLSFMSISLMNLVRLQ